MATPSEGYTDRIKRTAWFRDARFGMFIHFGLYAIPARGEWVRSHQEMSVEDYQPFFDTFNPTRYDACAWARLAKEAGMRYAVLTAKHHDGFCLFDSVYTEYKVTNTPYGKDIIKEYVEAFRAEGIRVGIYYSLLDWYHPDYPSVYGDFCHPMRNDESRKGKTYDGDAYITYMHNQVKELITNYGKIDIMWFDFSYSDMCGEAWRATDLVRMIRSQQPAIIIDNRMGGDMYKSEPDAYAGDFLGPEHIIPRKQLVNEAGLPLPWETCETLNNSWGYAVDDREYKTAKVLIRALVNCVSKGGNLLLNVGPNAKGEIPEESARVLREIGAWLRVNGESIYGCSSAPFEKPEWGCFTLNEATGKLYAHIFEQSMGQISMPGLKGKIANARLVRDGAEGFLCGFWNSDVDPYGDEGDTYLNFTRPVHHTWLLPDDTDTVVSFDYTAG